MNSNARLRGEIEARLAPGNPLRRGKHSQSYHEARHDPPQRMEESPYRRSHASSVHGLTLQHQEHGMDFDSELPDPVWRQLFFPWSLNCRQSMWPTFSTIGSKSSPLMVSSSLRSGTTAALRLNSTGPLTWPSKTRETSTWSTSETTGSRSLVVEAGFGSLRYRAEVTKVRHDVLSDLHAIGPRKGHDPIRRVDGLDLVGMYFQPDGLSRDGAAHLGDLLQDLR